MEFIINFIAAIIILSVIFGTMYLAFMAISMGAYYGFIWAKNYVKSLEFSDDIVYIIVLAFVFFMWFIGLRTACVI